MILLGGRERRRLLSNESRPRPFSRFLSKYSPFQQTATWCSEFGSPVVVCYDEHHSLVRAQLFDAGCSAQMIILEPYHRGTAAALALAALYLKDNNINMLVMSGENIASDTDRLKENIFRVASFAEDNVLVHAAPAQCVEFGRDYIVPEGGSDSRDCFMGRYVAAGKDYKKLRRLMLCGALWGTGILMVRPKTYLQKIEEAAPELYRYVQRSFYAGEQDQGILVPQSDNFSKISSMSVERVLMRSASSVCVCKTKVVQRNRDAWQRIVRPGLERIMRNSDKEISTK